MPICNYYATKYLILIFTSILLCRWTKSYLELIKDERGSNPPNVTGILNHLNMLYGDIESYNVLGEVEDENEAELKTNVLTEDVS